MSLNIDDFRNLQYNRSLIFWTWFNNIMLIAFLVYMSKSYVFRGWKTPPGNPMAVLNPLPQPKCIPVPDFTYNFKRFIDMYSKWKTNSIDLCY